MEINTSWENIVDLFQLALWPLFDINKKLSLVEFTGLDDKELNLASSYHDVVSSPLFLHNSDIHRSF